MADFLCIFVWNLEWLALHQFYSDLPQIFCGSLLCIFTCNPSLGIKSSNFFEFGHTLMTNLLPIILHTVGYLKTPFAYLGSCFLLALSLHKAQLTGRTPEILILLRHQLNYINWCFATKALNNFDLSSFLAGPERADSWRCTRCNCRDFFCIIHIWLEIITGQFRDIHTCICKRLRRCDNVEKMVAKFAPPPSVMVNICAFKISCT